MIPLFVARMAFNKLSDMYRDNPTVQKTINAGVEKLSKTTPDAENTKSSLLGIFNGSTLDSLKEKGMSAVQGKVFDSIQDSFFGGFAKEGGLLRTLIDAGSALIDLAIATLTNVVNRVKEARDDALEASTKPSLKNLIEEQSAGKPAPGQAENGPAADSPEQQKSDLEWEIYLLNGVNNDLSKMVKKAEETPGIHPGVINDFRSQIAQNNLALENKQALLENVGRGHSLQELISASTQPSVIITPLSRNKAGTPAVAAAPEATIASAEPAPMDDTPVTQFEPLYDATPGR